MRLLIVTMYSGENEFGSHVNMLQEQSFTDFDHHVISNLPNKEAHKKAYAVMNEGRGAYDAFMKLDADMVFAARDSLETMLSEFGKGVGVDMCTFPLMDFYTLRGMYGVHVWSNRVTWNTDLPDLFVDQPPRFPGFRRIIPLSAEMLVFHSPNPTPNQAFQFGVHRGIKAFHSGSSRRATQGIHQVLTLRKAFNAYRKTRDSRRGLAVIGAEMVRRGILAPGDYKLGADVAAAYETAATMSQAEVFRFVSAYWYWLFPAVWARLHVRRATDWLLRRSLGLVRRLGATRRRLVGNGPSQA